MTQRSRYLLMIVAGLLGVAAMACGGDPSPTPSPPAAQPSPTPAPPAAQPLPTATVAPTPPPAPTTAPQATPAPTPTHTPLPAPAEVPSTGATTASIKSYTLQDLLVTVGTKVTWVNLARISHTTTSGPPDEPDGIWNSGELGDGESFSFTFNEVGTFAYYCAFHPSSMRATVKVVPAKEDTTGAAAATATPTAIATPPPTPAATAAPEATATPARSPTSTPTPEPTAAPAPPTATPSPSPTPTHTPKPPPPPVGAVIGDLVHQDLTVPVGTKVTWTNLGGLPHTTTSGTPDNQTGEWNSPGLSKDEIFSHTFNTVGTFRYFCRFHPSRMQATVTVVASGG